MQEWMIKVFQTTQTSLSGVCCLACEKCQQNWIISPHGQLLGFAWIRRNQELLHRTWRDFVEQIVRTHQEFIKSFCSFFCRLQKKAIHRDTSRPQALGNDSLRSKVNLFLASAAHSWSRNACPTRMEFWLTSRENASKSAKRDKNVAERGKNVKWPTNRSPGNLNVSECFAVAVKHQQQPLPSKSFKMNL